MGNWRLRTYPIPHRSWRRAQQSPAIRFRIGAVVVEEPAIELWDPRKTTLRRVGGFMGSDATETYLILPRSWRQAQQPPAIGSRIGQLVVGESAIESWDHQHTIQ